MKRQMRLVRWLLLGGTIIVPSFVMRCDRMAMNAQRGFFWGLGQNTSDAVFDTIN